MEEFSVEELNEKAKLKIALGEELIKTLNDYEKVTGVQKIQRKIQQEIKFLQKVVRKNSLKFNHIQCSNLIHYELLVKILCQQTGIKELDCAVTVEGRTNPLRIDIICENGFKWIKAIARNSKSIKEAAKGDASYGARSILDQAEEYMEAAEQNLYMYTVPKVVFYFSREIDDGLLSDLKNIGIEIASSSTPLESLESENSAKVDILNLDITTLLAYISNVCNGGANFTFQESILTEQAEKERKTPLKPILDDFFANKRLICCSTASNSFNMIVSLLAGPEEKRRAKDLMERVEVLPDVESIPEQLASIKFSGKINERSLNIFAFGMQMRAITVTSNKAFVRSSKMQGINIPVFTHQARALTEAKEASAIPLLENET